MIKKIRQFLQSLLFTREYLDDEFHRQTGYSMKEVFSAIDCKQNELLRLKQEILSLTNRFDVFLHFQHCRICEKNSKTFPEALSDNNS